MVERRETGVWTTNRIVALIIGVIFTLLGLIGLLVAPSMAKGNVLGFDVDLVHNLFHLVTGVLGLFAAYSGPSWSKRYNQVVGIVYLIVGVLGLFYPALYFHGRLLGIMHVNAADHVLHLLVGIIATVVGFSITDYPERTGRTDRPIP